MMNFNDIEKALKQNEKTTECSNLFRIANSVCSLQKAKLNFELYITNIDDPRLTMLYYFSMGYMFNLEYYRDHKDTSKALKQRIDNILKLGDAVYKLEKTLERKDSLFNTTILKIRKMLEMMCLEGEALLEEELSNWNLAEYLKGIKDENKVEYIKTALSIPQGKGHPNLPQVVLDSLSNTALQSIAA